jgi:hypothetical protein
MGQLKERAEYFDSILGKNKTINGSSDFKNNIKINPSAVPDSIIAVQWQFNNWNDYQSTSYSYSADGKEEVITFTAYDGGDRYPVTRTTRRYDDNRYLVWQQEESYKDKAWQFTLQKSVTYNNGRVTEELYKSWADSMWVNYLRYTSTYDSKNREVQLLQETWTDKWNNTKRYTSEYDENGDIPVVLSEVWSGGWVNESKTEKSYEKGMPVLEVYSQWENGAWKPVERTGRVYGSRNETLEYTMEQWHETEWWNETRINFTYDDEMRVTETLYKNWNITTAEWENDMRDLYIYNNDNTSEYVMQLWKEGEWENALRTVMEDEEFKNTQYTYTWSENTWNNYLKHTTYYRLLTSVDETPQPSAFRLEQNYPNPFNPVTTINYTVGMAQHVKLNVYNILGQLVRTLVDDEIPAGKHNVQFNAAGLSSGVYYYRIEAGSYNETKSMILVK